MHFPLRLACSRDALRANYRWLQSQAEISVGAAIKADGYGLGAQVVFDELAASGCRDFFVSNWAEAAQLDRTDLAAAISVLHGVGADDLQASLASTARPVLNTPQQIACWKEAAADRPCDVMIDTGMNRLGLRYDELSCLDGLAIHTVHSHLACADEDHPLNDMQLHRFADIRKAVTAERYSLANSAGILLGSDYRFDLVRPGLALYGGVPRAEARGYIRPVASIEAQVVQRRLIKAGESAGYSATFVAAKSIEAAVVNIGYADGYWRGFSSKGAGSWQGLKLPVLGRVSMDLVILDCSAAPDLREGEWVEMDFELERAAAQSGMSQYELLTGLGHRFGRDWR